MLLAYEYDPHTRMLLLFGSHENFYSDMKRSFTTLRNFCGTINGPSPLNCGDTAPLCRTLRRSFTRRLFNVNFGGYY